MKFLKMNPSEPDMIKYWWMAYRIGDNHYTTTGGCEKWEHWRFALGINILFPCFQYLLHCVFLLSRVFVLFTVGQYAVAWASYFEKKLTMEEHVASKLKKMQRKAKKKKQNDISEEVLEEMEQLLTKPTFKNTLPFQFFNFIISLPSLCLSLKLMIEEIRRARQEKMKKEKEEAEELERLKKEIEEEKEREKERKSHRRKRILPDLSNEPEECILDAVDEPNQQVFLVIFDTLCPILIQLFSD